MNELLFLQITWWFKTKGNHDITWQELRTERRHQFFYPKHFAFIFSLLTISNVNMINSPSPIFTFSVSKFKLHALDNHQDLSHENMLLNLWKKSLKSKYGQLGVNLKVYSQLHLLIYHSGDRRLFSKYYNNQLLFKFYASASAEKLFGST